MSGMSYDQTSLENEVGSSPQLGTDYKNEPQTTTTTTTTETNETNHYTTYNYNNGQ